LFVVLAAVFQTVLPPAIRPQASSLLFVLAILLSARYGGTSAGLLATALGAIGTLGFRGAPGSHAWPPAPGSWIVFGVFVVAGGIATTVCAMDRAANRERDSGAAGAPSTPPSPPHSHRDGDDNRLGVEQAIRDREEQFRTLAEAMPQFVWATRPDGGLTYVNRQWTEFTGLTLEETRGEGWHGTIHPEDLPHIIQAGTEAIKSGQRCRFEFRCRPVSNETYRWFLCRVEPVLGDQGELRQWIWTSTEVDDQKKVEAELREADQRKDEFLAMLGHELRTPLGVSANTLHLMRAHAAALPELERLRARLERQTHRMGRLIDDMQDVSRISRGKLMLQRDVIDLAALVRDSAEDQRAALEEAGLKLTLEIPPGPLLVEGDATRLSQVLVNLLNNAAKFTDPEGKVTVRLSTDAGRARVTIQDTGIGISPEMLPHVFKSFAQEERSLDRTRGGLGLGLALVKGLTELHGGEVCAASAGRGQGAEMTVWLPRSESAHSSTGCERKEDHD
jgi:PAS domain S-box-containing protein